MKMLILGSNGLIGKEICRQSLIKNVNIETIGLDRNELDLSEIKNINGLKDFAYKQKIDAVIVLAAIKRQLSKNNDDDQKNNEITETISRAFSDLNKQITYISSCAVYGEKNDQLNADETTTINPTSKYGFHKVKSELIYQERIEKSNLLILRPPLIYGMNEQGGYNPTGFLQQALKNQKIELWGDGLEKREFIHVADAANIIIQMTKIKQGGIYNLTNSKSYSYQDIAKYIKKKTQCEIIRKRRTGDIVNHSYNNCKLKGIIGDYRFKSPYNAIDEET